MELLFIDFSQPSLQKEIKAIHQIALHFCCPINIVSVHNLNKVKTGPFPGRNASFLFLALMHFNRPNGIIALGIHSGTNYFDCSQYFLEQLQDIFSKYTENTIKIDAPFVSWNKKEIIQYCLTEDIPLNLTYSCELGYDQSCNICATCKDLKIIYECTK